MRAEVDSVLGAKTEITQDELQQLEYTGCVFKEALRKWPAVSEISRTTVSDTEIDGYSVPKDSWICVKLLFNLFILMNDP